VAGERLAWLLQWAPSTIADKRAMLHHYGRPLQWRELMNDRLRDWLVPPVLLPLAIVVVLAILLASNW